MHVMLEKYFALQDALQEEIDGKGGRGHWRRDAHNCLTCSAQKGWQDTLSETLIAHGVDLQRFVKEDMGFANLGKGVFKLDALGLTLKNHSQCVSLNTVLRVAARLLPED